MGKKKGFQRAQLPTATGTTQSQAGCGILFPTGFWITTNLTDFIYFIILIITDFKTLGEQWESDSLN